MIDRYSIKDYLVDPILLKLNEQELVIREKIMEHIIRTHEAYKVTIEELNLITQMGQKNTLVLEKGFVTSIYPVSSKKTNKKVIFEDESFSYAMCAIDAIGYHYAFRKKIRIEGFCQYSNEELLIEMSNGVVNILRGPKDIYVLHTD